MGCKQVTIGSVSAIVCGPDSFVSLEPFGAKDWCEYHNYLGPSFYRSERAITEIARPSRKTWDAFQKWRDSLIATPASGGPRDG